MQSRKPLLACRKLLKRTTEAQRLTFVWPALTVLNAAFSDALALGLSGSRVQGSGHCLRSLNRDIY